MAFVRAEYVFGEVQPKVVTPSRMQPKVTLASFDVNVKLAEVLVVIAKGMVVRLVSGGVLSTVMAALVEIALLLEVSTACALTVAAPSGMVVESQSKL